MAGRGGQRGAGAAVEREAPDVSLAGIRAATHVDRAVGGVQFDEALVNELWRREGPEKLAVGGAKLDLPGTARLGGPEEFPAAGKPSGEKGMVVKVEPGDVGFAHEFGGGAGGGIGAEEQRCLLRTVHDGKAERIARLTPDHAGEIGELGSVPIDP